MPALESEVVLSPRLRVVLREMTAEETFDADEVGARRRSNTAVLKTYAICSIRKVNEEFVDLKEARAFNRFLRDPVGNGSPLLATEIDALLIAFLELDKQVADPNASSASPAPPEGAPSPAP